MFRAVRFSLGLALSLLCLWLAVRSVPVDDLRGSLAGGTYGWLLPAVFLQVLSVIARSRRWVMLLEERARLSDAFWAHGVGYLFTNLFPLRMGEPARVAVMSGKSSLPFVQVATSAAVERLLDVATIVVVLVAVLPWMKVPPLVSNAGIAFGVLVLVAFVVLLLIARFSALSRTILMYACRLTPASWAPTIISRWGELISGLLPLTSPLAVLRIVGWSVVTWAPAIGVYWCVIRAFKPDGNLLEAAFMVVALALAIAVPSSPGFIGVFQFVGQQALVLPFGGKYDMAAALAITLTAHLIYYLVTTLLGVGGLWHFGKSFAGIARRISSDRAAVAAGTDGSVLQ